MSDEAATTPSIAVNVEGLTESDTDQVRLGALMRLIEELGLRQTLFEGILELVPDASLWRLSITGDMIGTVNRLSSRWSEENTYTTDRGSGTAGAITLAQDDGTFDIVISTDALLLTANAEHPSVEDFVDHTFALAKHVSRHKAGHAMLGIRGEDSDHFNEPTINDPSAAAWTYLLAINIEENRIEQYTAAHAPSPLKPSAATADELAHLRGELNGAKASWRFDIDDALYRTARAANGLIRHLAYLAAELGLDEDGRPRRPYPLPEGWEQYVEPAWDEWGLNLLMRLRPVDEPMMVPELEAALADLCRLADAWLKSIGVDKGIDDEGRAYVFWTQDRY